jgi:hypothetical protein
MPEGLRVGFHSITSLASLHIPIPSMPIYFDQGNKLKFLNFFVVDGSCGMHRAKEISLTSHNYRQVAGEVVMRRRQPVSER